MKTLSFHLKDHVTLVESGETGEVIGRAEYVTCDPHYLVRYRAGDGRQVEVWWVESALRPA